MSFSDQTRCAKEVHASKRTESGGASPREDVEIERPIQQNTGEGKNKIGEDSKTGVSPSKKKPNLGNAPSSSTTIEDVGNMRTPTEMVKESFGSKGGNAKLDKLMRPTGQENPTTNTTPRGKASRKEGKGKGSQEMPNLRTQMDDDLDTLHSLSPFTSPERVSVLLPTTSPEGKVARQQQLPQQQSKGEWPLQTRPFNDVYEGDDEDDRRTTKYEGSGVSSASKNELEEAQARMEKEAKEKEEISAKLTLEQEAASLAMAELAAEREKNAEMRNEMERQRDQDSASQTSSRSRSTHNLRTRTATAPCGSMGQPAPAATDSVMGVDLADANVAEVPRKSQRPPSSGCGTPKWMKPAEQIAPGMPPACAPSRKVTPFSFSRSFLQRSFASPFKSS